MPLRLRELPLRLEEEEAELPAKAAQFFGIPEGEITRFKVVRRGVDARKKSRILLVYTVELSLSDEEGVWTRWKEHPRVERVVPSEPFSVVSLPPCSRVVVVGMGPAGLFAALHLARHGQKVILVERGRPVEDRVRDVRLFWSGGPLDPASNVQFGEGGAGTFSDGKLTTRINHPWTTFVLQTLVDCGAPDDILVQAKPHVGTDRLRLVLMNFRKALLRAGVDIRFNRCLTGMGLRDGTVASALFSDGEEIACDSLLLAPGHSARDTYAMLRNAGVALESKPFAVGVRIEHPVESINTIQYGVPSHPRLPTAEYALKYNDPESGRGIYSFCMCPGGEVIVASSEAGGVVVNGMSSLRRSGPFSNSALVVGVRPADFGANDPLAGVSFQRRWEEAAFAAGGGDYSAPAQNLMSFLGRGTGPLRQTVRPGVREADLSQVLPPFVTEGLCRALPLFDRKMKGFVSSEAVMIGVETRTSAPLRILRGEDGQSVSHRGLYPAGEGAGYAGGIVSAALDGLKAAEHIVGKIKDRSIE